MKLWPDRGLWRHRDFLNLWAAQAVSAFGSRITRTAIPALAILVLAASDTEVALLGALAYAPSVVVGALASGFIDRTRKRPILVGTDIVRALLVLSIPVAAWTGQLSMAQLYAVAIGVGAASALFQIADQAYLPAIVGREHVVEGNAKLEATDSVAEIAGPGLAGILIQLLTAPVAMLIDAASFLWSALFLVRIKARETLDTGSHGPTHGASAGIAFIVRSPFLMPLFLAQILIATSFGFFTSLYMLFALRELGLDIAIVGIIIGLGGFGALAGALCSSRITRWIGFGPAVVAFLALTLGGQAFVPLAEGDGWLSIAFLSAQQLLGDCFAVAYFIQAVSLRQYITPPAVIGRVVAAFIALNGAALLAGAFIAVGLAGLFDTRTTVWIGVLVGVLAILPVLVSPIVRLKRMEDATAPA